MFLPTSLYVIMYKYNRSLCIPTLCICSLVLPAIGQFFCIIVHLPDLFQFNPSLCSLVSSLQYSSLHSFMLSINSLTIHSVPSSNPRCIRTKDMNPLLISILVPGCYSFLTFHVILFISSFPILH